MRLIDSGLRFRQHEGRDLDIEVLVAIVDHLVGAVHGAEGPEVYSKLCPGAKTG